MPAPDLVVRLDAWLPQTQCTRCGYPGCRAYAEALAAGDTDLNRCPPGGEVTLHALAGILGAPPKPLDLACGAPAPRTRAVIDETRCIGCRKCLDVCPVDAIVGARKRMHTVIGSECNGCELCAPPCPVDCIAFVPFSAPARAGPWPDYTQEETTHWRARTERRLARRPTARKGSSIFPDRDTIRRDIAAALDRVKAKRKNNGQDLQD
ncbi:MAG: RnfABCDGE type electron transport complex subunit B [Gammaproteobacteria bacterium]|nr:RnfABCDGE type electron transport complex subunit B [Gammaproteobacteria bacterium]